MALSDDVQNRIDSPRLVDLTNPRDANATAVDTTVLGYAATDIQADFELLSSENYDSTNVVHTAIAVPAVMAKLYEYKGQISPNANESMDVFIAKCNRLREGNLPGPKTNANYLVENESSTTRKHFDWKKFRQYRPTHKVDNDEDD